MKYSKNPEVETEDVDGELIVLNAAAGQVHKLNPTAAFIFELCDGQHTDADIAAIISEEADISLELASKDVQQTLASLKELGVICA